MSDILLIKHVEIMPNGSVHVWNETSKDVPAEFIDKPLRRKGSNAVWECHCTLEHYNELQPRIEQFRSQIQSLTAEFWTIEEST